MSDDRIQSGPTLWSGQVRTISFEMTDEIIRDMNRQFAGWRASLPWIVINVFVGAVFVGWGFQIGFDAGVMGLTVAGCLIGCSVMRARLGINGLNEYLAARSKYPNQCVATFSNDGLVVEVDLARIVEPWELMDLIRRTQKYWVFSSMGMKRNHFVPSSCVDRDLAGLIEANAENHRVPICVGSAAPPQRDRESGGISIKKPAGEMDPRLSWLITIVIAAAIVAWSLATRKTPVP
jgi:hypothetical protein